MASKLTKRNLYRPAGQNPNETKPSRKTLAQGRVVQDGLSLSSHQVPSTDVPSTDRDDQSLFPKPCSPHVSAHEASNSTQRTKCLDLSDSDDDFSVNSSIQSHPVMTIDATRHLKDANSSEVEVIVGYKNSPAKVVCHSPMDSNTSRMSQRQESRRIEVDHVPSMSVGPVSDMPGISPLANEDNLHLDLDSAKVNFPQPDFSEQESVRDDIPRPDVNRPDLVPRLIVTDSESDVCSLHEYVQQKRKPIIDKSKISKDSPKTPGSTKKKKKGRVIPSRYMQSINSSTSLPDKNVSKNKSVTVKKELKYSFRKDAKPPRVVQKKKESSKFGLPDRPQTPDLSTQSVAKTSTPTQDGSLFPQGIDESAIQAETSAMSSVGGHFMNSTKKTKSFTKDAPHISMLSNISNVSSIHNVSNKPQKKSQPKKKTQQDLDLMYGLYIQWAYAASKMRKARMDQEKKAMQQLHGLWEENERIREKNFQMEQEIAATNYQRRFDEQLEMQEKGLTPVMNNLNKFQSDYSNLALALDTTRHQIATKGIHIPKDEDEFQEEMISELEEMEDKLKKINFQTDESAEVLSSFANVLETLEKAVTDECDGIKKGVEYLAASKTLLTHENSLKIGIIEEKL